MILTKEIEELFIVSIKAEIATCRFSSSETAFL